MTNSPSSSSPEGIRGNWHGPSAWKLAGKRCLSLLVTSILFFVGVMLMSFDVFWVKILVLALFVCGAFYYHLRSGEGEGERDCAWAEGISGRMAKGETIPEKDSERCFHPLKGFFAAFVGSLPFLIPCILLAVLTQRQVYTLTALPSWTEKLLVQPEFGDALSYYTTEQGVGFVQILRIFVRAMLLPYFNLASDFGNDVLLTVERLTPVLMLIPPLGFGMGYTRGQIVRNRVLESIRLGVEKKEKKQRRERKKRVNQPKKPEQLI